MGEQKEMIKLHVEGYIGVVIFDAPPLNILTNEFLDELEKIIDQIANRLDIRVVVLKSNAPKAFIAGADISQFQDMDKEKGYQIVNKGKKIFNRMEHLSQPVIAAINGVALGGGLELVLACDIRIIERTAKIGLPEVTLGVFPGYGGTQRLTRLIGPGKTKELIYTGEPISGEEAYHIGVAEQLAENGYVYHKAFELASNIVKNAPLAINGAKQSIDQGCGRTLEEGQEIESKWFSSISESLDILEGVEAFNEKRAPEFKGK